MPALCGHLYFRGNMISHKLSVAPMMDWTDKHCRYFHRLLSYHTVLYTEMVTSEAILNGDKNHLLSYNQEEHPLVLQIGGSDAVKCGRAVKIADEFGYDEYNLNVGCPSDRVQSGRFGACLMYEPNLVSEIVQSMRENTKKPVTVKCRLGVDDQNIQETLPLFVEKMVKTGVKHLIIHARKAWLKGLSPKENRTIPPLDYNLVYEMKKNFPKLEISINGGIETILDAQKHLNHVDGVMIGRSAYHNPCILMEADSLIYNDSKKETSYYQIIQKMNDYINQCQDEGIKFYSVARHLLGFRHGQAGARKWRQLLTEYGTKSDISQTLLIDIYEKAFGLS